MAELFKHLAVKPESATFLQKKIKMSDFPILSGAYQNIHPFNPPNIRGYNIPLAISQGRSIYRYGIKRRASSQLQREALMNRHQPYTKKKSKKRPRHFPYRKPIPSIVPKTKIGLIRWVGEDYSYAPAATTGIMVYNLNSAYDPGKGTGAALPQWWTELSAIYHRYTVLSTKWHLHISNTTADQVQGGYCVTTNAEVPPTTAAGLTEAIQKGNEFWLGATDENLSNHLDLYGTWRLKDHLSDKNEKDTTMGALMTNDPSALWILSVVLNSASNVSVKSRMVMEMIVELKDFQQNAPD